MNPNQKIKVKVNKFSTTIPRYICQQTISCGKGSFWTPIGFNHPIHPIASHNSDKLVQFRQYWIAWYSSANDIQQLFFGKSTFYSSKNSTFLELLAIQFLTWFIPSCIQEYISQTTCRYSRIYQSRHSSRRKFQRLKRRGNTWSKPSHPFYTQPLSRWKP